MFQCHILYFIILSYFRTHNYILAFWGLFIMPLASMLTHIWLESPRKYIPISRMSPNHVQSGRSPGLIFSKNCTNLFAFFQWKVAYREYVKTFSRRCPKKNRNFRLKIGYDSGCNIKYTWLLKVEYLLNGSTDLYKIWNWSSWYIFWSPNKVL